MKMLFSFIAFMFLTPSAWACTPISSQTTITNSGFYCVTENIIISSPTGHGITVNASNVVIDLQGHAIIGPNIGIGSGVHAVGVTNVTIRGGNISQFLYGVRIEGDYGRIERMDLSENLFRGARVLGAGSIADRNRMRGIKGTGGAFAQSHSFGIEISGPNCVARFNIIDEVYPYGDFEGVGISVSSSPTGCMVHDNLIRWERNPTQGRLLGIWGGGGIDLQSVHNNVVLGSDYGLFRGRATTHADNNLIRQRCPVIWEDPDYPERNDLLVLGGCTDPEAGY